MIKIFGLVLTISFSHKANTRIQVILYTITRILVYVLYKFIKFEYLIEFTYKLKFLVVLLQEKNERS